MHKAFIAHKWQAQQRGIAFVLTFEEWLAIWEASGHLHERGCRKGQYVMARFGDAGPYAIGNVRIVRQEVNHAEYDYPAERRSRQRAVMAGNTFAVGNKSKLGTKHSDETRARMTASQKLRWAKRRAE